MKKGHSTDIVGNRGTKVIRLFFGDCFVASLPAMTEDGVCHVLKEDKHKYCLFMAGMFGRGYSLNLKHHFWY